MKVHPGSRLSAGTAVCSAPTRNVRSYAPARRGGYLLSVMLMQLVQAGHGRPNAPRRVGRRHWGTHVSEGGGEARAFGKPHAFAAPTRVRFQVPVPLVIRLGARGRLRYKVHNM